MREQIKSPSDTTLYAPAVAKVVNNNALVDRMLLPDFNSANSGNSTKNIGLTEQISQFIAGVRIQDELNRESGNTNDVGIVVGKDQSRRGGAPVDDGAIPGTSQQGGSQGAGVADEYTANVDAAKERANQLILDAERYKATLNNTPGMLLNSPHGELLLMDKIGQNNVQGAVVREDDEFFYVTCHLDDMMRNKIEHGEYVELEKLLPKQRGWGGQDYVEKLDLIVKDGKTYFAPAVSHNKIGNVRCWEQAFRVYAAVYSQANPSRAAEIWQYVHIINSAASAYTWENVSYYDVTFRHLMAQNPLRSWAKIYNQMWNLAMRDALPRNNNHAGFSGSGGTNKKSNNQQQKRKIKHCWAYNKGECKSSNCKFVHRCSYCDDGNHIKINCPKKNADGN